MIITQLNRIDLESRRGRESALITTITKIRIDIVVRYSSRI